MSKKNSYLWGLNEALWHAILVHDPEYVIEEKPSERLTQLAKDHAAEIGRDPNGVEPVMIRRVTETLPGSALTVCGLGSRGKDKNGLNVRKGIPISKIGIDPDKDDPLCPVCVSKIESET